MKLGIIAVAALVAFGTFSCKKGCTDDTANNYDADAKKDDGTCTYDTSGGDEELVTKSGELTSDETWTTGTCYKIEGKVVVPSGVTLTIEKGVIVKGAEGTGTNASALIVARGGKINAVGTAAEPIIFTSVLDNIACGSTSGTNLDETENGKWGGVIILGNAPISAADGDVVSQIEGIPATSSFGAYGGSDVNDNSGTLSYVSIRHGGALIGAGNEINGLTLGGVGNGTVINHIEVISNQDDGVECFGGSVDLDNVVVGYVGDDAIDLDQNYSGTITNFVVIANSDSDEGLEIDGPEGSTYVDGMFTLTNGTVYTKDGASSPADLKSKAQGTLNNVKFESYTTNNLKVRASYQNDCQDPKTDAFTYLTATTPSLIINGSSFNDVTVYTGSTTDDETTDCTVFPADQTAASAAVTTTTAIGADVTVFGWAWVSINGKL